MRLTMKIDTKVLETKLRRMASVSPQARTDAVKIMAGEVMRQVVAESPRDTNRLVRGWAQAANAAGVGPIAVPPLERASRHDKILWTLRKQVIFWARIVERDRAKGRNDKWANRAVRKLDRAKLQLEKFQGSDGAVIAINLYRSANFEGGLATVRDRVYGGTGAVLQFGTRTFVQLHNREPHTSIVESYTKVVARAQRRFKGAGLTRASKAYILRMTAASGMAGAA